MSQPRGLSVTPAGHLLVTDPRDKRVAVFSSSGSYLHDLSFNEQLLVDFHKISLLPRIGEPTLMALKLDGSVMFYSLTN